ncbi:cytidyltransferase [Lutibacter profundi]|uniref:N-acylneuraminate cytidylyltransferase n=1 Tax=Lutibacter profundi TaxID=1622118 RepID=A0A0X8G5Q9_9FLAO|nr:acylneuraminate cytidylyltransferase [Lutibacter profundi]AMC10148.1 cytidyltransferase [Lutibacter profundi]
MLKKIGIIPLRKGSKSIVGKNTRKMVGRSLFMWVLGEAIFSKLEEVYVFTDDIDLIEFINTEYAWSPKVKALLRSKETATDTASTEFAMEEFSKSIKHDYDVLCLLQATSPLTTRNDINNCLNKIEKEGFDSVVTVVNTHRFTWNTKGSPTNYDVFKRPRRQDFEGLLIENGAVYSTTKNAFIASGNRVSGNIGLVEMPGESLHEIDSESDWLIVEQLLMERQKKQKESKKITHLVLDVDGVFTNGTVFYSNVGEMAKQFDMRDGMGLEILREQGIEILVMTSEQSDIVTQRMKKLKIENVYLGVKDKYALLNYLLKEKSLAMGNIAYMGDDVNDLANMCSVGWSLTPNNATTIVKQHADVILTKGSGNGAIREGCEFIMKYNKRF